MITTEKFINIIVDRVLQVVIALSPLAFKLGCIPAEYVSGKPAIQFDGESSPSVKTYPYLSSYTPTANDRVLLAQVGHGGVILGKIINE